MFQRSQRIHDHGKIEQGFAHAHVHEIAYDGTFRLGIVHVGACHLHLSEDLPHGHVAPETEFARTAEGTGHGTAHLCGDALRHAHRDIIGTLGCIAGNKHRFYEFPVGKLQQKFGGAVGTDAHVGYGRPADFGLFRKLCPVALGNVGHDVEAGSILHPYPLPQLHGAEFSETEFLHDETFKSGIRQIAEIDFA